MKLTDLFKPPAPSIEVEKFYLDRNNKIIKAKLNQGCYYYHKTGRNFVREGCSVFANCESNELVAKHLMFNSFKECYNYHINRLNQNIIEAKKKTLEELNSFLETNPIEEEIAS